MANAGRPKPSSDESAAQAATIKDLSDQISVIRNDIATLTSTVGEVGRAKVDAAAASARSAAEDVTEAARLKAMEGQIRAEDFIRTQPMTALGIAAGIGFLIGLSTRTRR